MRARESGRGDRGDLGDRDDRPVVVVGAGVVGLACARALARAGHWVVLLERERRHGQGTSSRSSGVIHAGLYYATGSLKATLCVEGRERLYAYAAERSVPHRKCGKLIVATSSAELPALQALQAKAHANGVHLQAVGPERLRKLAPGVTAVAGLWSPETGIIDAHALMDALAADAAEAGAVLVTAARVVGAQALEGGWGLTVERGSGTAGEGGTTTSPAASASAAPATVADPEALAAPGKGFAPSPPPPLAPSAGSAPGPGPRTAALETIEARCVVNAAGLYADEIARLVVPDADERGLRLDWVKGNYFSIRPSARAPVSCLVYPCPQPERHTLGVHLTLDLDDGQRLGPDVEPLPEPARGEPRVEDYHVDPARGDAFLAAARRYLPHLVREDLEPAYAGIRPLRRLEGFGDFHIRLDAPGWVNLVGIDSPGLTSCLAIGRVVGGMV